MYRSNQTIKNLNKHVSKHDFKWALNGLSLGILIFSILSPHQCCLCRVEAVKSRHVHSIRDVIFQILKDRSARHFCCAYNLFIFFYSAIFLLGGSSIPHLNTVESPLRYVACFLNLSIGVLSVICCFITSNPLWKFHFI
jgi:hypothetical protein